MNSEKKNITIEILQKFSPKDAEALRSLAAKVGGNYKFLSDDDIREMLDSPSMYLVVARESEQQQIVGMLALVVYRIPYVRKGYLDDMVVDESYRGYGIGSQLITKALAIAQEKGAAYVDLTARPIRTASNSLYEKLGFKKRETNVYRMVYDYGDA